MGTNPKKAGEVSVLIGGARRESATPELATLWALVPCGAGWPSPRSPRTFLWPFPQGQD